jgi:predicted nucleic acid-binding protein
LAGRYLIDSSAWIEFFRASGSPAHLYVRRLAEQHHAVATTQPILLELRAGAQGPALRRIDDVVGRAILLDLDVGIDFDIAGDLYHAVQTTGHTVRSVMDCLIAAVAIRTESILVHQDRDFDRIAAVAAELRCADLEADLEADLNTR